MEQEGTDFYSHALAGRDRGHGVRKNYRKISTHTPSQGVTTWWEYLYEYSYISTHTPSQGVTAIRPIGFIPIQNFYSHALAGRDR